MKYVLVYYDQVNLLSYFFNFNDKFVYVSDKKDGEKSKQLVTVIAPLISILFYAIMRTVATGLTPFDGIMYIVIALLISFIVFLPLNYLILFLSKKTFKEENKKTLTVLELISLYEANKPYRKKYIRFTVGLTLFTAISTLICSIYYTSFILFICNIILLASLFIMISAYRPFLTKKFESMIKSYK